jgi:quinol monooxygenase YgiN
LLTIMAQLRVKAERLDEYLEIVAMLTRETIGKRQGCIAYSFNQRIDDPVEFVLYDQWESEDDLNAHIEYLKELLGPAKPGGLLPEKLMNMYESGKPFYYKVIE